MSQPDAAVAGVRSRIVAAWAVLVGLTVLAWWHGGSPATRSLAALLLGATALKAGIVMGAYMEVAHAPGWLKALCLAWGAAVLTTIAVLVIAAT